VTIIRAVASVTVRRAPALGIEAEKGRLMIDSNSNEESPAPLRFAGQGSKDAPRQVLLSEDLLGQGGEVAIRHGAETYRLRRTRSGKLILTK
jgi:hemin uptake protein HemP